MMKTRVFAACLSIALFTGCTQAETAETTTPAEPVTTEDALNADIYRDLITSIDYRDEVTYVIGHKNPDTDTVSSAMAYAYLLNQLGIKAQAAVSEPVNNETNCLLDRFSIVQPQVIDNAEGKQFVLVDHSQYSQAIDGMNHARIVGIVDHHGIGDAVTDGMMNIRSAPAGSAASIVYLSYRECGIDIPQDMAQMMLGGLLSDTRNMIRNVTELDRTAYADLLEISGIEDPDEMYNAMAEAIASYGDMDDTEIFYSDYKEYEAGGITYCIADVNAFGEDRVIELSDRMYTVMEEEYPDSGLDMMFVMINNKDVEADENMMYMLAMKDDAAEVLDEAFGTYDGTKYFVFKDNLSRKADIVPAISEVLNRR